MIESFKIVMPKNPEIKEKLQKKFAEYSNRIQKIKNKCAHDNPELSYNTMTGYKTMILERLLSYGEVETMQIAFEMKEEFGKLDPKMFNSAARVINDYCMTGGKNVTKGSGF